MTQRRLKGDTRCFQNICSWKYSKRHWLHNFDREVRGLPLDLLRRIDSRCIIGEEKCKRL